MTNKAENHYLVIGSERVIINCYLFISFWCLFVCLFQFMFEIFWWLLGAVILLYANILFMSGYADHEFLAFSDEELVVMWGRVGEGAIESGVAPFFPGSLFKRVI